MYWLSDSSTSNRPNWEPVVECMNVLYVLDFPGFSPVCSVFQICVVFVLEPHLVTGEKVDWFPKNHGFPGFKPSPQPLIKKKK